MKLGSGLNRVVTMNRTLLGALTLAIAFSAGACQSFAKKPLPDSPVITFDQQQEGGFRTQWQWAVGLNNGEKIENMWRVGDALFVYTDQDQLHSFAAATGTKNWTLDLGPNRVKIFAPAELADGGTLMIVSRSDIYYVDKRNGALLRRASLAQSATNQPVICGENLCYGSAGFFYGTYMASPDTRDWSIRAENDTFVAPILKADESHIVAVTLKGQIWVLNPANGVAHWAWRKVNGNVVASPAVSPDKKTLVVVADDKKAYAFNFNSGNGLWGARLNGELTQQPIFSGNTVLTVGDGYGLYALDANTGAQKWLAKDIRNILRADESEIIASNTSGALVRLNPEDGSVVAFSQIKNADRFLAAAEGDANVYVATKDGRIAAVSRAK